MTMETSRLLLRPWRSADAEELYRYAKDPAVGPAAGWPAHTSVQSSRAVIRDALSAPETYAVVLKSTGKPVGCVGVKRGTCEGAPMEADEAEIGYWLGVPYWGQGLIPEAVRALLRRCFEELDCAAVWCGYYDGNEKSRRVQEKCGFRYHHTEADKPCPLLGETRTEHFTRLERAEWEENSAAAVRGRLFALREEPYRDFMRKLIPTVPPDDVIGIRTPELRRFAKELAGQAESGPFLRALPHRYFEENQLHAFLIAGGREFDAVLAEVEAFLPFVDNWATCDQLSPKVFLTHRQELLPAIRRWLGSGRVYTVRFAVGMLMEHYLDDAFDPAYPGLVAGVRSEEYYVNMMIAWYFATALAKQYDAVIGWLEDGRLAPWTHRKAIQKALESYRIPDERKAYLRTLRT